MNKYITPTIEIEEIQCTDVITASGGVTIGELEGVDNGNSKSAIFSASHWINR